MKKIILFMVYYGKLPSYFDVWLEAIKYNETIDFCIITDCFSEQKQSTFSSNIIIKNIAFADFKKIVQSKFDFKISMENYGRISQFRPAFGYIFPDIIEGYDFWGYIECDLIPGNIRNFLTENILSKYDKCFKLGHFQLFRNTDEMNTLFMSNTPNAINYRFAFSHNIFYFEEVIGMYNIAIAEKVKLYDERVFVDCQYMYNSFRWSNFAYWSEPVQKCIFAFENGKLYMMQSVNKVVEKKEILYVHFQKRNMNIEIDRFSRYLIIPNKFTEYRELNSEEIQKIIYEAEASDKDYYENKLSIEKTTKRKRNKTIDWWLFCIKRLDLKHRGSVGLSGKAGVL